MNPPASTDPLTVFERWYAAHENRDVEGLSSALGDDVEVRSLFRPEVTRGREAAITHFLGVNATFSDLTMALTCPPAVAADRVLVEVSFTGKFTGELTWLGARYQGQGQRFEVPGVAVVRSSKGQVRSVQTFFDRDAWLLQVGVNTAAESGALR